MHRFDSVDLLAFLLLAVGLALFAWGFAVDTPSSMNDLVERHYADWTPGFVIDGILLLVLNRVIQNHERRRVINQVASLSNEFALDAVRRCREEGWLQSGVMANRAYVRGRLASADLSDANLPGTNFTFADLSYADLTHADLCAADFKGANLRGADLRWANLSGASLEWADLREAQLDGAILDRVKAAFASIDGQHAAMPVFADAVAEGFLTTRQQELVRSSFDLLMSKGDAPVVRFYERLFEVAPQLRPLFRNDIRRQSRKFLQSLRVIVNSLSSTERAAPVLQRLGERHRGYGVAPEHYQVVEGVLIDTFAEVLGPEFTEEVREAWCAAFRLISSIMSSMK
jgi:hemoglobin-like flavoprotein